jgi:hypothetical protein
MFLYSASIAANSRYDAIAIFNSLFRLLNSLAWSVGRPPFLASGRRTFSATYQCLPWGEYAGIRLSITHPRAH